jgi:benzoyl-CoA reductase subunit BamB
MRFAETGFNLEIDLSTGNVERVESDPKLTALHLGGLGTNTKLLWDRVTPDVGAFDEDNLLIFAAGLLTGTAAPGANRTIVSTISPQTNLMGYSMMGGFFAPELKHAGYDKIVIRGKSPSLVYLSIHNDKVEIRDATHLAGKGSVETAALIKEELKDPKAHVAAIGLAGENRVYFASIEQGRSSASRLGLGAVMGDKGLKAIAVRGTKDVNVAKPIDFLKHCQGVLNYIQFRNANPVPGVMPILQGLGSPQEMLHVDEAWHTQNFMWGNSRTRRKDFWSKEIEEKWTGTQEAARKRLISCCNCPMQCGAIISMADQSTYMMKCFSKLTYTMAAYSDLDFGFRIAQKATEYGIDGFSGPQVMAFGLELLEAGILTDNDFDGMPSDNEGKFYWLLDRIVRREGIGDILADGTYWAAQKIGKGADAFAHNNIKKHEQLPLKLGMLNPVYFLMYATGEKANITQIEGQFPQSAFPTVEEREAFNKDWIQVPDEKFKQYLMGWELRGENSNPTYPTVQMSCDIVDWQEKMHYIDDAVGMCAGLSSFPLKPPYHIHNYPEIISAATGLDIDKAELEQIYKRNRTMLRAFNNRRGMTRADDCPPENHWKKRFPELEKELLEAYYKFKGWNLNGVPTTETLNELGMGYVAEDLESRGISTAADAAPPELQPAE